MTASEQTILELIKSAKNILLFSHKRPDWDAFSSLILATTILKENFPEKKITANIEQGKIENGEYIEGYSEILRENSIDLIEKTQPDLIILTDCSTFTRISFDEERAINFFVGKQIPVIGLDHHPLDREYLPELQSNHYFNSSVEEVHSLFIKKFNFADSATSPKCLAVGIMGDTNNFMFLKGSYNTTLDYVRYILDKGLLLDEVSMNISRYTKAHFTVLAEFLKNCTITDFVTYFYISDEFYTAHPEITPDIYSQTKEMVNQYFLRNVSFNKIFFLIYKDKGGYKGSLRALIDTYDTTVFATYLNGGGQKPASGYFINDVSNVLDAINKTMTVLEQYRELAIIPSK